MLDIEQELEEKPEVRELKAAQRRVLGALLEKAFTTPEYYPMTLKALVAACNQKSNRSPLVTYDGDRVEDVLEELREMGLIAVIHTGGGRTERYRHYVRKRFTFSERQLAILTELLLRGRQTMGELRGRASRMVEIESLPVLRTEMQDLLTRGYVRASGSLERRGIEVDHAFYESTESNSSFGLSGDSLPPAKIPASAPTTNAAESTASANAPVTPTSQPAPTAAVSNEATDMAIAGLKNEIAELQEENREIRSTLERFQSDFEDFRRRLGDM